MTANGSNGPACKLWRTSAIIAKTLTGAAERRKTSADAGLIRNVDRAAVVLHHALTGKLGAARATGYERSSFGRNSKLLQAWTRGQINLAPASAHDNSKLVASKTNSSSTRTSAIFPS